MKHIGLIGGVSWVSTAEYYRRLNKYIQRLLGKHHSAKIILYSFDFEEILIYQKTGDEANELRLLHEKARLVEEAGADIILICSNTTNKLTDELNARIGGKIISIVDATVDHLKQNGVKKVGLLGTKYTMELDFYKDKLRDVGIEAVVPDESEREYIHAIIYDELCHNIFKPESKQKIVAIINRIQAEEQVDGIILACTELPLLVRQQDVEARLFDTIDIHITAVLARIGLPF